MRASHFGFVEVVAADRDLVVTRAGAHACRLEPRASHLTWFCDLDDGTPTGDDDPASFVRWVCPALRLGGVAGAAGSPLVDVRRTGPQSDVMKLMTRLGRHAGRAAGDPSEGDRGPFTYTDPAEIFDGPLRQRIEYWPSALHGDGVVRPAELGAITMTHEGLIVESSSWWDSAPVLHHQIQLAVDLAKSLAAQR
ncbi:MAG: hypothetical protein ABIP45_04540 [Knoellia sp.]